METQVKTLAVYTTIYPGVESFLGDWYRTLSAQTDRDYELWIGLDAINSETVKGIIGVNFHANWIVGAPETTPASIREQVLAQIVDNYDGIVLVDSDDLLHPTRVAAARSALQTSDLTGCALRLVDQLGQDLGLIFGLPPQAESEHILPRNNVFGFSNSAIRTNLLRRCLPIPTSTTLVDWFLATQAWLLGAKLSFDAVPRMDYRQHSANTARVRFPFSRDQVVSDTALVRKHFKLMLAATRKDFVPDRVVALKKVIADVEEFHQHVVLSPSQLERYVHDLNALEPLPLWWSCVAYDPLGSMWRGARI
ncbi:MAG TPA: hypothetical protein VGM64_03110 [Lacunisphaera sp.]|jgi:hypothetical protein